MRNPVRTEAEAFGFVIAVVALFAAVALVGIFVNGWAALLAFLVLAPIVGYRYFASDRRSSSPRSGTEPGTRTAGTASWSSRTRPSRAGRCATKWCGGRGRATPRSSSSRRP